MKTNDDAFLLSFWNIEAKYGTYKTKPSKSIEKIWIELWTKRLLNSIQDYISWDWLVMFHIDWYKFSWNIIVMVQKSFIDKIWGLIKWAIWYGSLTSELNSNSTLLPIFHMNHIHNLFYITKWNIFWLTDYNMTQIVAFLHSIRVLPHQDYNYRLL